MIPPLVSYVIMYKINYFPIVFSKILCNISAFVFGLYRGDVKGAAKNNEAAAASHN